MDDIRKTIGRNIKAVCRLKGVRQIDVSGYMGVSQGTVSNWFKGVNSIDVENLAKLCAFLGVSLDQIFGVAPIDPETIFSEDEKALVHIYRSLNDDGRRLLMSSAQAMAGNPSLKKEQTSDATA